MSKTSVYRPLTEGLRPQTTGFWTSVGAEDRRHRSSCFRGSSGPKQRAIQARNITNCSLRRTNNYPTQTVLPIKTGHPSPEHYSLLITHYFITSHPAAFSIGRLAWLWVVSLSRRASTVMPSESALKFVPRRWRRTGRASESISSIVA